MSEHKSADQGILVHYPPLADALEDLIDEYGLDLVQDALEEIIEENNCD